MILEEVFLIAPMFPSGVATRDGRDQIVRENNLSIFLNT